MNCEFAFKFLLKISDYQAFQILSRDLETSSLVIAK